MGSKRKLGQSPMQSQQVLVLIVGIIYGRPVQDVSSKQLLAPTIQLQESGLPILHSFLDLYYTWVKSGLKSIVISNLQGSMVTIAAPVISGVAEHSGRVWHLPYQFLRCLLLSATVCYTNICEIQQVLPHQYFVPFATLESSSLYSDLNPFNFGSLYRTFIYAAVTKKVHNVTT